MVHFSRLWSGCDQIKSSSHVSIVFWRHRDLMRPDSRCETSASNHLSFVYGSRSHRLQGIPRPTGWWDTICSGWFIAACEELLEKPVWHQLQTRDPATARLHETGPSWIPYISGLFVASPCFVGEIHVGQPLSPVSPDIFDIPISIYRLSFGPGHVVANLKLAWNPRLQVNPWVMSPHGACDSIGGIPEKWGIKSLPCTPRFYRGQFWSGVWIL